MHTAASTGLFPENKHGFISDGRLGLEPAVMRFKEQCHALLAIGIGL